MNQENDVRPNYYRLRLPVRALSTFGDKAPMGASGPVGAVPVVEPRATTWVELECQDLIEALGRESGVGSDFNVGNALKYLFRAGRKAPSRVEDLKKALTYLGFALAEAEREERGVVG